MPVIPRDVARRLTEAPAGTVSFDGIRDQLRAERRLLLGEPTMGEMDQLRDTRYAAEQRTRLCARLRAGMRGQDAHRWSMPVADAMRWQPGTPDEEIRSHP